MSTVTMSALNDRLAEAAQDNKIQEVQDLIRLGASPNAVGSFGDPVLVMSAGFGNKAMCETLIDAGADLLWRRFIAGFLLQRPHESPGCGPR